MKILEHRHTGLLVDDLDRMIEFYVGLGLVLKQRDLESGHFIDGLLNTESIVLETAKLILERILGTAKLILLTFVVENVLRYQWRAGAGR